MDDVSGSERSRWLRPRRRGPCRRPSRLRASGSRGGRAGEPVVAGVPAHDLVRLRPLLAHLLPPLGPRLVGLGDLARLLVEVEGLALAVRLDAHVDRRDRGVAGLGRAEGLGVPRADALDEVLPEGAGVVVGADGGRDVLGRLGLLRVLGVPGLFESFCGRMSKPSPANLIVPVWPRMTSSIGVVVAHRRGDDHLAALVVVGHHRRHVGDVAAVVLQVEAAAADDPAREADAHRLDQVRELVDEQVGVHAAAEVPVAAPLGELGAVEGHVGGQAELGPQEHLPVDRLGGHVLR